MLSFFLCQKTIIKIIVYIHTFILTIFILSKKSIHTLPELCGRKMRDCLIFVGGFVIIK